MGREAHEGKKDIAGDRMKAVVTVRKREQGP